MKIAVKDIEQFIINIPKNIRAILLYGPDAGLVRTRLEAIEKSYSIADKFKYDQIKNNPSLCLDSLRSINLFGENLTKEKLVIIDCSTASITEPVLNLVKLGNYKGLIIFCAGELGTDSNLRKCFDTIQNLASIPCYVDDQASIARIIQQQLKQRQMTCEAGVVQLLLNYIAVGNHALVLNEIEKIFLFLQNKKHIIATDLTDYLQLQGEVSFDKLCYQLSLRQVTETELLLIKLQNEGHNLVAIIRMIMRHFNRLYQVKSLLEQGKNEQTALASLYPAVFFKQVSDFSRSVKLWSKVQLIEFIIQLNELELIAKQKPILAELSLRKTIILLSK